jgi:hypothetical protein
MRPKKEAICVNTMARTGQVVETNQGTRHRGLQETIGTSQTQEEANTVRATKWLSG